MQVKLAGINIDSEYASLTQDELAACTPESIAAAYARISRRWDDLATLRSEAREELGKARESFDRIVYSMGHSSIQEHIVFNFDIEGVSRLLVECIQHSRLASYTERSYRYCKMDPDSVYMPSDAPAAYKDLMVELFSTYEGLRDKLVEYHKSTGLKAKAAMALANEDARYVTPLASLTSLGMTINARALSRMIRRLLATGMPEHVELANRLKAEAENVAPTAIRHSDPTEYDRALCASIVVYDSVVRQLRSLTAPAAYVFLLSINQTARADSTVCWAECTKYGILQQSTDSAILLKLLKDLGPHDPLPRSFELVPIRASMTLSASAFAQLKRHRMCTIIASPYDPYIGCVVPPAVEEIGAQRTIAAAADNARRTMVSIGSKDIEGYCVINGHMREALVQMNLRELYHFCRMRQDKHAQWEIRSVANQIVEQLKKQCGQEIPIALSLLCGKDTFEETKSKIFP